MGPQKNSPLVDILVHLDVVLDVTVRPVPSSHRSGDYRIVQQHLRPRPQSPQPVSYARWLIWWGRRSDHSLGSILGVGTILVPAFCCGLMGSNLQRTTFCTADKLIQGVGLSWLLRLSTKFVIGNRPICCDAHTLATRRVILSKDKFSIDIPMNGNKCPCSPPDQESGDNCCPAAESCKARSSNVGQGVNGQRIIASPCFL